MARRISFTVQREPIELEIGGDVFTAPPVIPAAVLGELIDKQNSLAGIDTTKLSHRESIDAMLEVLGEVFDLILVPESGKRFRERLFSREQPFDLHREVMPAVAALVEEYTDRPTQPSSSSANGSPANGGGSTDGAPKEESTLSSSTPAGSAT